MLRAIALAALIASHTATASAEVPLAVSEWRPTQIMDETIVPKTEIFLRFGAEGRLEGDGGCNRFSAPYTVTADRLEIGLVIATRKACPLPFMDREQRLFSVLEQVFSFERTGIYLSLIDQRGDVVVKLRQTDAD